MTIINMTLPSNLWAQITSSVSFSQLLASTTALVVAFYLARVIYNLNFHPLSKYPGPRLAGVTDLWWAYASTSGRYPWIVESVLTKYGDIVRIAPNELVFLTPQAAKGQLPVINSHWAFETLIQPTGTDIYLAQEKTLELFVQVGYDAVDTGDNGISGEPNPVKHREVAKKLAPAFSARNFRAKEATVQKHIDFFINKMKEVGAGKQGAELQQWTDWLALDLSLDMTYGRDMGQMRDMMDSIFLSSTLKLNLFLTMSQITRKFRFSSFLGYLTIPPSIWFTIPKLIKMNTQYVKARIERRGKTEHLDYFEQLLPFDKPVPEDKKQIFHLENIAGQLLIASWQPLANQFYTLIFFLLKEPNICVALVDEVRTAFADYDAINTETVGTLKYLVACVQESLRLHQDTVDGLPRVSPGAIVDGTYIPRGVTCQISYFAATRSPRFFTDPLKFRPERWLTPDHPRFDSRYEDDSLKASKPFSQGLRGCPGGIIAVAVIRLFIAKVLWTFDLEAVEGQEDLSFDKDFKFLTFWERPPYWVRFKPI